MGYKINSKLLALRLVSLAGFVYQAYYVTILYLSNDTTTNVKYVMEDPIMLPGVTLCIHKMHLLNLTLANKHAPIWMRGNFHYLFNWFLTLNMSMQDQLLLPCGNLVKCQVGDTNSLTNFTGYSITISKILYIYHIINE